MLCKKNLLSLKVAAGILAASMLTLPAVQAADHQEAPGATAQLEADIGDYYAWHEGDNLNLVLTFGTFGAAGSPATYSSDVLYAMHFDTTADGVSDLDLYARFAQDDAGAWGVQVSGEGIETISGAVETVLTEGATSAWAGLADDPFFFDLTGFNDTVATGTISFDPMSDDVAGLNITAVAIQVPASTIPSGQFQTWATTSSK